MSDFSIMFATNDSKEIFNQLWTCDYFWWLAMWDFTMWTNHKFRVLKLSENQIVLYNFIFSVFRILAAFSQPHCSIAVSILDGAVHSHWINYTHTRTFIGAKKQGMINSSHIEAGAHACDKTKASLAPLNKIYSSSRETFNTSEKYKARVSKIES